VRPEKFGYGIPCYFVESSEPSSKVVIYFHANAEDIAGTLPFVEPIGEHWRVGESHQMHFLVVEYPQYGLHVEGKRDEETFWDNAESVFDFLSETVGLAHSKILVFGRSLGSGPATYLASKRRCAALLLFTPYLSIKHVSKTHVGCMSVCAPNIFRNCDHIASVTAPTFIIHGKRDEIIPHKSAQELYKLLSDKTVKKKLVEPEAMTHNRFRLHDDFLVPSRAFLLENRVIEDARDDRDLSDSIVAYIHARRAKPPARQLRAASSKSKQSFEPFEYK